MTNTVALVNPAIVLSVIHSTALVAKGMAANVATTTMSDARHAVADLVRRADAVPANAPAR